jgi:serine/threonine protein kinase
MGPVYEAIDTLGRVVVLKILHKNLMARKSSIKEFKQLARRVSALVHPNICQILDLNEAGGVHFIAMQHIGGRNLGELLKGKPLELEPTLSIAIQVTDALAAAHSHGIIHRDIKPANVMVTNDGLVKVMDFGIAKLLDEERPRERHLTRLGALRGTINYAAPEEALGRRFDSRVDVFSTGVLLYEMLTGRLPFRGETDLDVRNALLHHKPATLAEARPGPTPVRLQKIVDRALAKDPRDRYQTIEELGDDLKSVKRQIKTQTKAVGSTQEEAILHANLWIEDTHREPVSPPPVLSIGTTYFLCFAIEPKIREMVSSTKQFVEPNELRESPSSTIEIVVVSDLLKDAKHRTRRLAKYYPGKGITPVDFALVPESEGQHSVTIRLFYRQTIIYRERMCVRVEPKARHARVAGHQLS